MTENDDYVCPFDEATVKKAQEELNENPHDRLSSVRALRSWVNSQPHMTWSTDTRLLLTFLRAAKFNQAKARDKMEGMLTVMTLVPEWFQNIDTKDEVLTKVIESGYMTPLPLKDDNGCQIILYRIGAIDPDLQKVTMDHEIRSGVVAANYSIVKDEAVEIHGYVFIFDFAGLSRKHMNRWGLEGIKKWFKCWQSNIPGRFKAIHFYNTGLLFDTMIKVVKPFLSQKFKSRVKVHRTIESLCLHVPPRLLPEEYLPDDYKGSSTGSLQQIIKKYQQEILSEDFRQHMIYRTSSKYSIDWSKKTQSDERKSLFRRMLGV